MRVILLGAGGLLGRHLAEELPDAHGLDRAACDLTNREQVLDLSRGAGVVVNCGAYTNVDGAEIDEHNAYRVNALGAENVALAARRHGARAVHVSTDFVFDGTSDRPYDEFDSPNPISRYGRSKWAGEQLVLRSGARVLLARVQALYGPGSKSFASRLPELVRSGAPLQLDCERRVQPTWVRVTARALAELITRDLDGIWHLSCAGETTWAGYARALAERLGVLSAFREVRTGELAAPAQRPKMSLFRHRMRELHGLSPLPDWQHALDEYLRERGGSP